ncbi:EAL domain-containing protein [Lederbergia wuyishanensis]|uniref:Diguanylate cyclase (GGDEF)-like protein/PAS domain S-box-containing protein n=1 Tax=Lederbergia wuyishanensis TaxID=1347903 RepID=A0ABU0CYW8_9BACI|nr:EAL domain-containing protein [Lederbergia wuyishanensis]MCJ8005980.1 EAL domain-containing protein [Lederbergia wuyishanensis]MDQ0341345.1 diguanylate cyclase (GGDEF)-like protein/PAS domain S-box-containing protein [Lederbergia wuyishanensis]
MSKSYTYIYKDKNDLLDFMNTQNFASNELYVIKASLPDWESTEINQLKKFLLNFLPNSVFIPVHSYNIDEASLTFNRYGSITETFNHEKVNHIENDSAMADLLNITTNQYINLSKKYNEIKEYFFSIVENIPDIIFTTDLNGCFTSINTAFKETFALNMNEIKDKSALDYVTAKDVPIKRYFIKAVHGIPVQFELNQIVKTGDLATFIIHMIPINVQDKTVEVFVIGRNITKQRKIEKKMERIAYYDADTGLPNRMKFDEILQKRITKARKGNSEFIIMFLDLDRFKTVNDMLGHKSGDKILKTIAKRIFSLIPKDAYLGRFSGDKFSIIMPDGTEPEVVLQIGKELLQSIQMPLHFENQELYVSASIGISTYPTDANDNVNLMKNADAALNRAKQQGGSSIVFFSGEMNKETWQRIEIERSLRKALENNELYIAYQPIIDIKTGNLSTCEALLRWDHPEYGLIPPIQFIPIAEEIGLIHSFGNWVLKNACKQTKEWHQRGIENLSISVNVSAFQFQNKFFIEEVKEALKYSGLEAKYLHLELTESAMLNHTMEAINTMHILNEIGVNISIDDFGTGYSSLSYLKQLPIHRLKIDRSFINNIKTDSREYAIVNAIMTMGHGLGLNVVAEGVETKEQLTLLKKLKCDYIQGYFVEKPMPPKKFEEWYYSTDLKSKLYY